MTKKDKFGKSIHYCNLKINDVPLVDFAQNINHNLNFVGMCSVTQTHPGPISSTIYNMVENIQNEF